MIRGHLKPTTNSTTLTDVIGQTANAARHDGERTDNAYAVVGIRLLY